MSEKEEIVRCYIAVVSSCREVFGSVQLTNATRMIQVVAKAAIEIRELKTIERKSDEVKSV